MKSLDFAIAMEYDGEKYYRDQARSNQGNRLQFVFERLADEEVRHARELEKVKGGGRGNLPDIESLTLARSVFTQISEEQSEFASLSSQLAAYEAAMEMEKKSIDLYFELHAEAEQPEEKELLSQLVAQERSHLAVLEELVLLLRQPQQWVESAEFGRRKEY